MAHPITEPSTSKKATLRVQSSAFVEGGSIPERYTSLGDNLSPPLSWSAPPADTSSFVLICEDPDAPGGTFDHWVAWGIPATARSLAEGASNVGDTFEQGLNDAGTTGYFGPKPPPGSPHRYVFRLFALDSPMELPPGATRTNLERMMKGHVLAEGRIVGRFGR